MTHFDSASCKLLAEAMDILERGFEHLPEPPSPESSAATRAALFETAQRLHDNYPHHHPLYVGQMLKPPHPVARLAYSLAMSINPNNHALDSSPASSQMEREAVAGIGRMFGWDECLGHLCGGGTLANFEALWVGRELAPGTGVAASTQSHYTHSRISGVIGVPFHGVETDRYGRMRVDALEEVLKKEKIGTVVATLGTTSTGSVDPLGEIAALRDKYGFRLHVDTAYGGYFKISGTLDEHARAAYACTGLADSIVVDPHKQGLQPYGCGCIVFRDPSVGRIYKHDSPYTYFTSNELHLGEISLECSRSGAASVALWTTMQRLPLETGGEFAAMLDTARSAALELYDALVESPDFTPLFRPELDIVVWGVPAGSASESSALAQRVFDAAAERDLHFALTKMPADMCGDVPIVNWDEPMLTCLRACVMKPEHKEWMGEILRRLNAAARDARRG